MLRRSSTSIGIELLRDIRLVQNPMLPPGGERFNGSQSRWSMSVTFMGSPIFMGHLFRDCALEDGHDFVPPESGARNCYPDKLESSKTSLTEFILHRRCLLCCK